ncbi:TMEM175 family protein [Micromonospora sp. CPCC 205539]|uniref:TMEM175 family protein n=1 Tax=Micromonospora sp. CPCC 205539 TaxID=3122408 RepID=UPI002FF0E1F4
MRDGWFLEAARHGRDRAPQRSARADVTDPARTPGGERPPSGRLISLSDAVFAISITLLVLELRPPADTEHLARGLIELWPSLLAYVISFLLIGEIWADHHLLYRQIVVHDRVLLFLNTSFLMSVAFLPFSTSVLADAFRDGQGERAAVVFYGLSFGVGSVLFNAIWLYASHGHRRIRPGLDAEGVRATTRSFLLAPLLNAAGVLVGAIVPTLGLLFYVVLVPVLWLPTRKVSLAPGELT